jgi:hypothetical protein
MLGIGDNGLTAVVDGHVLRFAGRLTLEAMAA